MSEMNSAKFIYLLVMLGHSSCVYNCKYICIYLYLYLHLSNICWTKSVSVSCPSCIICCTIAIVSPCHCASCRYDAMNGLEWQQDMVGSCLRMGCRGHRHCLRQVLWWVVSSRWRRWQWRRRRRKPMLGLNRKGLFNWFWNIYVTGSTS